MATDMRLWLLDQVADVQASLEGLVRVMVERADKERDILMPGYTHLQVRAPACVNLSFDPYVSWIHGCGRILITPVV